MRVPPPTLGVAPGAGCTPALGCTPPPGWTPAPVSVPPGVVGVEPTAVPGAAVGPLEGGVWACPRLGGSGRLTPVVPAGGLVWPSSAGPTMKAAARGRRSARRIADSLVGTEFL